MLETIIPKSDQLNADDLIGGVAKVIKVTTVRLDAKSEQPCAINYENDQGKPFKPCKSMRRVLVNVWGADASLYVGRSMELVRDDSVKFGGLEVGGIRISRISHIDRPVTMALTASKAVRKPFTVKPLPTEEPAQAAREPTLPEWFRALDATLAAVTTDDELAAVLAREDVRHMDADDARPRARDRLRAMVKATTDRIAPPPTETAEEAGEGGDEGPGPS
jgi:hypothetical protein